MTVSRAKTKLYVSHMRGARHERSTSGLPTIPSRFLRELPAEMISSDMAYDEPRA